MDAGAAATVTPVTVKVGGTAVTATLAEPVTFVNPACAEWAVQVAVPVAVGVKTPPDVMVPPVAKASSLSFLPLHAPKAL